MQCYTARHTQHGELRASVGLGGEAAAVNTGGEYKDCAARPIVAVNTEYGTQVRESAVNTEYKSNCCKYQYMGTSALPYEPDLLLKSTSGVV